MYLSKLEILGFKSFATKTQVSFNKGITGIVGPNGCGKTNIVDAIRWSLGEQKSSTLRSDKMENVIFNGTRQRKPMGMSEVSLTLVNDRGVLPTEFSEVTITRRIFRSGESEYLLNGNLCRLKDITNLFMDTGMGSNAYSVIELKMVENILSNRTEERRNMFEEAAGVNKYKLRRRLALKKLEEIKGDLTRVNDIVSEVDKKVTSLERQAKRADKYNQYVTLLKEKEIDLAEREFALYCNRRANHAVEKQNYLERKENIDFEIKELENELIAYRDQISEVESELSKKRKEVTVETEKLHNIQKNISVAEERNKSLTRNLDRFRQELEELKIQSEETDDIILENEELLIEINEKIVIKSGEIDGFDEVIEEKRTKLLDKKSFLKQKSDEIIEKFKDINAKENLLKNNEKNFSKNAAIISNLESKINSIENKIVKTTGFLEELNKEQSDVATRLAETEKELENQTKYKEDLENKITDLRKKEFEEATIINNLKTKIEFLQTLIANLEGVAKGSKSLINNEEWSNKEKHLFSDIGTTKEEYRFAVEASLKFVLNNLLIENVEDLTKAFNFLKDNDLGKASFYLLNKPEKKKNFLDKINNYFLKKKINKLINEQYFVDWAYNLIETKEKYLPYFNSVLENTVVVDTFENALDLSNKYPDFSFVSLKGDFVSSSGIVEAGSSLKDDESLFGRKQMLDDLERELPKYENNLVKLQEFIEETEYKLNEIDLKSLTESIKVYSNENTNLEKQIAQLEFEKIKADEEIEKTKLELNELSSETNNLEGQINYLKNEIEIKKNERTSEENILNELEIELKEIEKDYNNTISNHNQKKVELERFKGELQNTTNAISRAKTSKENIIKTIEKRENDISSTTSEISSIITIIEDNQISYDEVYEVLQALQAEESKINNVLKSIKEEAGKYEKQLQVLRNERENTSDKIHEFDLSINKLSMRIENLSKHILEEYSTDLIIKEFEDLESFDYAERTHEVTELKNKLKGLGPINLLAYSEYEEERERLEFLQKQRNDLVESEKDILKTIEEINETAQNLFKETFELIRENFIKIFRNLFNPGDEADLKLEEDVDPLEAKIEIIAKPKGKRPTSIELLSGGEKTLTATALLFAIYLVKPSPFCILDEVDAPLDDANVERYTRLIKEFSKNTQFIMVTHNKKTMEAAETMYGVTMQEEGVSKLVSVQFNEELSVSA